MDKFEGQRYFWEKSETLLNILSHPVNRLYTEKTSFQGFLKEDRRGSIQKDETNPRKKQNAADLAKLWIKYVAGIN